MIYQLTTDRAFRARFPEHCVVCMPPATARVDMSHERTRASFWMGGWDQFIGEGDYLVPACRRHWLPVALDFWGRRIGAIVASAVALLVHFSWVDDPRATWLHGEYGILVSMLPLLVLNVLFEQVRKPWISSEVRDDEAIYAMRSKQFADAFLSVNEERLND